MAPKVGRRDTFQGLPSVEGTHFKDSLQLQRTHLKNFLQYKEHISTKPLNSGHPLNGSCRLYYCVCYERQQAILSLTVHQPQLRGQKTSCSKLLPSLQWRNMVHRDTSLNQRRQTIQRRKILIRLGGRKWTASDPWGCSQYVGLYVFL